MNIPKLYSNQKFYSVNATPNSFEVAENNTDPLSIDLLFTEIQNEDVTVAFTINFNSNITSGTAVSAELTNITTNSKQTVSLSAGQNSLIVKQLYKYKLSFNNIVQGNDTYTPSNDIVIENGALSVNTVTYDLNSNKVHFTYYTSWGNALKINDIARDQGYSGIALAFFKVDCVNNDIVVQEYSAWNQYMNWQTNEPFMTYMTADIKESKEKYGLKYVVISVGGENNTFKPKNCPVDVTAQRIYEYVTEHELDGIDFDLEHVGDGFGDNDPEEYLYQLNVKLMELSSGKIIITCAPQISFARWNCWIG